MLGCDFPLCILLRSLKLQLSENLSSKYHVYKSDL